MFSIIKIENKELYREFYKPLQDILLDIFLSIHIKLSQFLSRATDPLKVRQISENNLNFSKKKF
jgi:hypothetical protein